MRVGRQMMRGGRGEGGRGAFTLVELLVVIAIIVVLIAILIPSLNKAQGNARSVACRSGLKQLAVVGLTYEQEWNGYYVPWAYQAWNWNGTNIGYGDRWMKFMSPYSTSVKAFNCPLANKLRPSDELKNATDGTCNYAYNLGVGGYVVTTAADGSVVSGQRKYSTMVVSLATISAGARIPSVNPERVVTFLDGRFWVTHNKTSPPGNEWEDWPLPWTGRFIHNDNTFNAAFIDGHVENLFLKQMYTNLAWPNDGLIATKTY